MLAAPATASPSGPWKYVTKTPGSVRNICLAVADMSRRVQRRGNMIRRTFGSERLPRAKAHRRDIHGARRAVAESGPGVRRVFCGCSRVFDIIRYGEMVPGSAAGPVVAGAAGYPGAAGR